MTDHPLLMSGPMMRAYLAGRKTQTRRLCKQAFDGFSWAASVHPDGSGKGWIAWWPNPVSAEETVRLYPGKEGFPCPYGVPGESRLWFRETWQDYCPIWDGYWCGCGSKEMRTQTHLPVYQADPPELWLRNDRPPAKWCPSIHMPRWAARCTPPLISVRVERVQDITEEDARAEGITEEWVDVDGNPIWGSCGQLGFGHKDQSDTAVGAFRFLWNSIYAKRGMGWDTSPWVWVLGFPAP